MTQEEKIGIKDLIAKVKNLDLEKARIFEELEEKYGIRVISSRYEEYEKCEKFLLYRGATKVQEVYGVPAQTELTSIGTNERKMSTYIEGGTKTEFADLADKTENGWVWND